MSNLMLQIFELKEGSLKNNPSALEYESFEFLKKWILIRSLISYYITDLQPDIWWFRFKSFFFKVETDYTMKLQLFGNCSAFMLHRNWMMNFILEENTFFC